jgi:transposase
MRKIKDVLRLKLDAKLSHEQIAGALGISKGVVTKYVGLAAVAGLDWPAVQDADEITLERRLLVAPQKPRNHVQPDYGRVHQELRRKGMTLMLLWEEYRADHADRQTYAYSQFCDKYRRFAKQLKRSMRQIHRAGEKLFIDYAGPTIALTDGTRAHIFVAAMGASSYTFAYATPRETMADWLESTARALSFYGGVTQLIVPDNPRALIAEANRYEPRSNDTVLDFARHYGTSILPARPYHPQDNYRACLGLLSLAKRFGKPRLEAGCMLALQIGACQYRHVRNILVNNRDQSAPATAGDWVSPNHAHVRGPGYYQ